MAAGQSEEGQQAKRIEDTQRYVRRSSALLWEIKENRNVRQFLPYLPLPIGNMMTDTAYGWEENTPFEGSRSMVRIVE